MRKPIVFDASRAKVPDFIAKLPPGLPDFIAKLPPGQGARREVKINLPKEHLLILHMVKLQTGRTIQDIVAEAIDHWIAHHSREEKE